MAPALWLLVLLVPLVPLVLMGVYDTLQTHHAIRRNFPLLGHVRYPLEFNRPEIQQHFVESETDGRPIPREIRSTINGGAKDGDFFHNTGEGGLSRCHLEPGDDVCWQVGTGYLGCRTKVGDFDPEKFKENAGKPSVTMIEIKLSQGAKPVGFKLCVGWIQARRCNTNTCPTGVATQDPKLIRGLVVKDKRPHAASFHRRTIDSFVELLAAAGLTHPEQLQPRDVFRRISRDQVSTFEEIYEYLEPGDLLGEPPNARWKAWLEAASLDSFHEARMRARPVRT